MPTKGYMAKYIPCKKFSVYDKINIDRNKTCINTDSKPKKFVEFCCNIVNLELTTLNSDLQTNQTWLSNSSSLRDWLRFALSSSSCLCWVLLENESIRSYRLGMYQSLSYRLTIASNTLCAFKLQPSCSAQLIVEKVNNISEDIKINMKL